MNLEKLTSEDLLKLISETSRKLDLEDTPDLVSKLAKQVSDLHKEIDRRGGLHKLFRRDQVG